MVRTDLAGFSTDPRADSDRSCVLLQSNALKRPCNPIAWGPYGRCLMRNSERLGRLRPGLETTD